MISEDLLNFTADQSEHQQKDQLNRHSDGFMYYQYRLLDCSNLSIFFVILYVFYRNNIVSLNSTELFLLLY